MVSMSWSAWFGRSWSSRPLIGSRMAMIQRFSVRMRSGVTVMCVRRGGSAVPIGRLVAWMVGGSVMWLSSWLRGGFVYEWRLRRSGGAYSAAMGVSGLVVQHRNL